MSAAAIRARTRALEGAGLRTFGSEDPIVWERTAGAHVWDADGREYLEMNGGFAAASIGFCHPRVTAAIAAQAGTMTHCPSAAPSQVRADFYERLIGIAPDPLTRVIPAITG
ncbi:MAG: aminotransferase class III-fold pyridoxal phosphate-dependent enzyme, partial [Actinomycetota bacterium]